MELIFPNTTFKHLKSNQFLRISKNVDVFQFLLLWLSAFNNFLGKCPIDAPTFIRKQKKFIFTQKIDLNVSEIIIHKSSKIFFAPAAPIGISHQSSYSTASPSTVFILVKILQTCTNNKNPTILFARASGSAINFKR